MDDDITMQLESALPNLTRQQSEKIEDRALDKLIFDMEAEENEDEKVLIVVEAEKTGEEPTAHKFCGKTHEKCGHACKGVERERKCLPCLNKDCAEAAGHFEGVTEDELCTICYT